MSKIEVDKIIPQSGTALQVGESGDTITIPAGATITNNGTANGFGSADTEKVKVSSNDTTAGFLNGKLVAGTNISLTEGSDGGNETLTAALTGTIGTSQIANSAVDLTSKVTGALPVANGGTNLTSGFANGITMAEQWRLSAVLLCNTLNADVDVTANLEKVDTDSPGYIGSSMTESSGVFTFPTTGIYLILNNYSFNTAAGGSPFHGLMTRVTTDNSSYSYATENYVMISSNYNNGSSSFIFDVTNTSTHKVKFSYYVNGETNLRGNTSSNHTHFTFIRLGDT